MLEHRPSGLNLHIQPLIAAYRCSSHENLSEIDTLAIRFWKRSCLACIFYYHGSARLANQFPQALFTFRGEWWCPRGFYNVLGCLLILLLLYRPNAYAKKYA